MSPTEREKKDVLHFSDETPVCVFLHSLVRGPGVFGDVQVYWNITPALVSEFETISGTVTMRNGQSVATITLKVLNVYGIH